jgi:hypothetical protein
LLAVVIRLLKKARPVVYAHRIFEVLAAKLSNEAFAGKAIVQSGTGRKRVAGGLSEGIG